jgi:hypothetical protein
VRRRSSISEAACTQNRLLGGLGQFHWDKVALRIEIVFARFVDDANLTEVRRIIIGDYSIELPQFERGGITLVPYANNKLGFRSLH